MNSPIFVLTTPRPDMSDPWAYLTATVAEIERQEPNCYKALVCDGAYDGPRLDGWDVMAQVTAGKGNRDAWWHLISAAASTPGTPLCFEDDIRICPGGLRRMLEFRVPGDLAAVKFFTPKPVRISNAHGLHRVPYAAKRSAAAPFLQAVKFSRQGLVALDAFRNHPLFGETPSADQTLGRACDALGLSIGQHVPDLVEHVGAKSKAHPKAPLAWWRRAADWNAEQDVRSLDDSRYG